MWRASLVQAEHPLRTPRKKEIKTFFKISNFWPERNGAAAGSKSSELNCVGIPKARLGRNFGVIGVVFCEKTTPIITLKFY